MAHNWEKATEMAQHVITIQVLFLFLFLRLTDSLSESFLNFI